MSSTKSNTSATQQLAKAVRYSRFNPAWFYKNVLDVEGYDPWQVELTEAVADIERKQQGIPTIINHEGINKISARAGHGPGKTWWVASLAHWWQFTRKGRVVVTATKERQIITRFMPEFRSIGNKALSGYSNLYKADGSKVVWCKDPDYFLVGETAREPENLAGYHHDYLLFIVDEASGIHEGLFPVIEGAISTGKVVALVMIGNPTKNEGTFYLSHMSPQVSQDYFTYHVSLDKSTRISKDWVEGMERKYGKDSSVVKIRCRGDFAEADASQLIPLQWVIDCREEGLVPTDGSIPQCYITVDVADGGEDESVINVIRSYQTFDHYLKMYRYPGFKPSTAIIDTARAAMRNAELHFGKLYKHKVVFIVDTVGVGAGVAGYLIDQGCKVVQYKGGAASSNSKKWRNQRSQTYNTFADVLRLQKIKFDRQYCSDQDWEDFLGQISSIRRDTSADKTDDIEPKKKILERGLKSPDIPDSCAMRYTNMQPITGRSGSFAPVVVKTLESVTT
jgi:hypothetical protein